MYHLCIDLFIYTYWYHFLYTYLELLWINVFLYAFCWWQKGGERRVCMKKAIIWMFNECLIYKFYWKFEKVMILWRLYVWKQYMDVNCYENMNVEMKIWMIHENLMKFRRNAITNSKGELYFKYYHEIHFKWLVIS